MISKAEPAGRKAKKPMGKPESTKIELRSDALDDLIRRAKADPQQFGALYDRFLASIYGYIYLHVSNRQETEELTSQTFLAAFEGFASYQHQGTFAAWLFGIARRKIADYYRRSHPESALEEAGELGEDPHYLAQTIQTERQAALDQLIAVLPEEERELLRLRFTAGLTYKEIALLLHGNEEAVKKRVNRLLVRLQGRLEGEHD